MAHMKYLALGVLHNGTLYRNSLVWLDGERVVIKPFDGEVPQTVFVSGLVAVCSASRLTDAHRRTLALRVQDAPLLERAILKVDRYLQSNSLYLDTENTERTDNPVLLLLPRK